MHELELVLLCGPSPSLMDAVAAAQSTILCGVSLPHSPPAGGLAPASSLAKGAQAGAHSAIYQSLLSSALDFPRHLPNTFQFHAGILGFLFVFHRGGEADADGCALMSRARMVSSFLPNPTNLSAQAEEAANLAASSGKKGRRSPSPSARRTPLEPPSPSQFAPSNPLFSSSLLSEASVLSRSHALLCFYEFVQPQLFPPTLSAAQTQFHASPPPSPRGATADEHEHNLPSEQTLLNRAATAAAASSSSSPSGCASNDRPAAIQRATTTPSSPELDERQHAASADVAPVVTDAYMLTPVSARGCTPSCCGPCSL